MSRPRKPLTAEEIFCLEGWLNTSNSALAYKLSHNTKSDDILNIQKMASRWLNRTECQEYLKSRRLANYTASKEKTCTDAKNRNRADAVTELNALISATHDPKTKGDLLLKLADLNKWKTTEESDKEKRISFYIPLKIEQCREYYVELLSREFNWNEQQKCRAIEIVQNVGR